MIDAHFGGGMYGESARNSKATRKFRAYSFYGLSIAMVVFSGFVGAVAVVSVSTLFGIVFGVKSFEFLLAGRWVTVRAPVRGSRISWRVYTLVGSVLIVAIVQYPLGVACDAWVAALLTPLAMAAEFLIARELVSELEPGAQKTK